MNPNIIFKENDPETFWKSWYWYCDKFKVGSRYSMQNLEMFIEISKFKSFFFADKSFMFLTNGEPAGIVVFLVEKNSDIFTGTFGGGFIPAPLFKDESVAKSIFFEIDKIAAENKLAKVMFSVDVFNNNNCEYNYLQKFGYLDASILNYVVDLSGSEDDFLRGLRHGHKSDVKKILNNKDFEVFFVDKSSASYELHEEYRALHRKCSGRVARSKKSFDLQFEKLKLGESVLLGLKYKGKNIAFSYFEFKGEHGIYEASADDPDYLGVPLYHALIFSAMKYLKSKGVRYLDMGQPSSPSAQFGYYLDEKQLGIALFKRGFGGYFKPNYRGIKYYNHDCFLKDIDLLVKNYGRSLD